MCVCDYLASALFCPLFRAELLGPLDARGRASVVSDRRRFRGLGGRAEATVRMAEEAFRPQRFEIVAKRNPATLGRRLCFDNWTGLPTYVVVARLFRPRVARIDTNQ